MEGFCIRTSPRIAISVSKSKSFESRRNLTSKVWAPKISMDTEQKSPISGCTRAEQIVDDCFTHSFPYEGDIVHVSFVVIKSDSSWSYSEGGVDLQVNGPSGDQIIDVEDKTSDKFEFVVHKKGFHHFCFTNKSPYHETVDFDVHAGHFAHFEDHAKDEHFYPLLEQMSRLEEALYNIQFEQHWLEAQTERQVLVNEAMSKRATQKALFEFAAVVGASVLQVYLLRRLFEEKLLVYRV